MATFLPTWDITWFGVHVCVWSNIILSHTMTENKWSERSETWWHFAGPRGAMLLQCCSYSCKFYTPYSIILRREGVVPCDLLVLLRKEVPVQPREKFQIVIIPLLVYVPLRKSNFVSVVLIRRIRYDTALDTGTCKSSLVVAKSEKTSLIDRGMLSKNRWFLKNPKGKPRSPFCPWRIWTRHRHQAIWYRFM